MIDSRHGAPPCPHYIVTMVVLGMFISLQLPGVLAAEDNNIFYTDIHYFCVIFRNLIPTTSLKF